MATIVGLLNWLRRGQAEREYARLELLLLPEGEPDTIPIEAPYVTLMHVVCSRTGLAPSEWKRLSVAERVPFMRAAGTLEAAVELGRRGKVAARRKLVKQLWNEHEIGNDWARLAELANADPEIIDLELPELTRHIVRNDCLGQRRAWRNRK